jgi:hypothetical protein
MKLVGRLGAYLFEALVFLGSTSVFLPWIPPPSLMFAAQETSDE